jgi:hypothetical protein
MAPRQYLLVASVTSRSKPSEAHVIKADALSGRLSCDCDAYRWARSPKSCDHIRRGVVAHPSIRPYLVPDSPEAHLTPAGIELYRRADEVGADNLAAVSAVIARTRPVPVRAVPMTSGRVVADRQRVALDGLTVDRLLAAARSAGVVMRQSQAVAMVKTLTGKALDDVTAVAALYETDATVTRRIVLED